MTNKFLCIIVLFLQFPSAFGESAVHPPDEVDKQLAFISRLTKNPNWLSPSIIGSHFSIKYNKKSCNKSSDLTEFCEYKVVNLSVAPLQVVVLDVWEGARKKVEGGNLIMSLPNANFCLPANKVTRYFGPGESTDFTPGEPFPGSGEMLSHVTQRVFKNSPQISNYIRTLENEHQCVKQIEVFAR